MGGRGSAGGSKITFAQARELAKQERSLNQRIGRLQSNIDVREGKIPFIGVTESGRKRLASAQKTYRKDKAKLVQLEKEREEVRKKLRRYQNQK